MVNRWIHDSPTYALSKHLVSILSPLIGKSPSHVRNSADFASFIAGQTVHQGMTLVSFDVVLLFTKVPVNLAAKVARERLTADQLLVDHTALSPNEVGASWSSALGPCICLTEGRHSNRSLAQLWGHQSLSQWPTW